ncbi:MAG: methylated-DNA--[protein]-cysteine S-methyltransferase [Spirochaetales bacterium]|nr:methylated-DNA--[protein]-cysteine S-methyltransferase [Spirochaetales bacterium]
MKQTDFTIISQDYYLVERAITYLEDHFLDHPTLEDAAESAGVSKYHFHRLFTRWAGITPDRFQKYLTLQYAKEMLRQGRSVLETAYEANLSSPGRLHDLFVTFEAVSPGEFRRQGDVLTLQYGFHPSPFGNIFLALTPRGICCMEFREPGTEEAALKDLKKAWPAARLEEHRQNVAAVCRAVFLGTEERVSLLVKGTNFQVKVWQALLSIPPGVVVSYGDLAAFMGQPKAVRAVAGAVAANPVAYLIPCHRVIAASGRIHGYRWGPVRKRLILAREASEGR